LGWSGPSGKERKRTSKKKKSNPPRICPLRSFEDGEYPLLKSFNGRPGILVVRKRSNWKLK